MGRKQALIGLFVILAVVGVIIGVRKAKNTPKISSPLPTPGTFEKIEETFNLTIPADVEKTDLKKVGDVEGIGIATRKFRDGRFELTILADLPDPETGRAYQGWLQKDTGEKLFLGNLKIAKGGYLLDFESNTNFSDYQKVIVVEETNILEGSF